MKSTKCAGFHFGVLKQTFLVIAIILSALVATADDPVDSNDSEVTRYSVLPTQNQYYGDVSISDVSAELLEFVDITDEANNPEGLKMQIEAFLSHIDDITPAIPNGSSHDGNIQVVIKHVETEEERFEMSGGQQENNFRHQYTVSGNYGSIEISIILAPGQFDREKILRTVQIALSRRLYSLMAANAPGYYEYSDFKTTSSGYKPADLNSLERIFMDSQEAIADAKAKALRILPATAARAFALALTAEYQTRVRSRGFNWVTAREDFRDNRLFQAIAYSGLLGNASFVKLFDILRDTSVQIQEQMDSSVYDVLDRSEYSDLFHIIAEEGSQEEMKIERAKRKLSQKVQLAQATNDLEAFKNKYIDIVTAKLVHDFNLNRREFERAIGRSPEPQGTVAETILGLAEGLSRNAGTGRSETLAQMRSALEGVSRGQVDNCIDILRSLLNQQN